MKRTIIFVCILIAVFSFTSFKVFSNDAVKNKMYQINFTSSKTYSNPVADIDLFCEFTSPSGISIKVRCFWNGGQVYCARICPNETGTWKFTTTCSDIDNNGIYSATGTFNCDNSNDTNKLYQKGKIKVSDDKRYLTYGNGEPFFYFGDTAWEITWRSTFSEVKEFIQDRKKKGFTCLQLVPMSHLMNLKGIGVINQNKDSFFLNLNQKLLNPKYFNYLDSIVAYLNDNEMIAVLAPLWAGFNELQPTPWKIEKFTVDESLNLSKYIGARYGGYHVAWIVAGDLTYEKPEQNNFWNNFALTLREADGWQNLATMHSMGSTGGWFYFNNETKWMDFNMYQSSHTFDGQYAWILGQDAFKLQPSKPVVDGEGCYEDIPTDFWVEGHSLTSRITAPYIRKARYSSILSGATVGITYGANGVFQWSTSRNMGEYDARFTVDSAWKFAGSGQLTVLKKIMEDLRWYTLKPSQELIISSESKFHIPVARNDSLILAYLPISTTSINLKLDNNSNTYNAYLLNTMTGKKINGNISISHDTLTYFPPDTNDVLLVAEIHNTINVNDSIKDDLDNFEVYPNPSEGIFNLAWFSDSINNLELQITDICGRVVQNNDIVSHPGKNKNQIIINLPGIYFYTIKSRGFNTFILKNGIIFISK
ncbi:MAG: DUF4038 domain-containing protein [Bacteroidota bacterium]